MTATLSVLSRIPIIAVWHSSLLPHARICVICFRYNEVLKNVQTCWYRRNVGNELHGNLLKAPSPAAVAAYHRRRMCHSVVSSPWWLKQEVTILHTPTWKGSVVTDFLSVAPGDCDQQGSIKANYLECILKLHQKPIPTHQMSLIMVFFKAEITGAGAVSVALRNCIVI